MIKTSESVKMVMAFPGCVYGSLKSGVLGGDTSYVNGAAAPGTTSTLGDTGPLGAPIDCLGFSKAAVHIVEQGATTGSFTLAAKTGTNDWFSHAGTTDVTSFSETIGTSTNIGYQRIVDIDLRNCQRYLWITALQTAVSCSRFSIVVVLSSPDKQGITQNVVDAVPA